MLDFYLLPLYARIGISALGAAVVAMQAFHLAYSCYERPDRPRSLGKLFFEGLLLVYLVLLATAPAVISISIREGVVAQSMLELPRWIVFTLLLCAAAALWRKNKALLPVVLLTAPTLPPCEALPPYLFAGLYAAVLLFHLHRSARGWRLEKRALLASISPFSIKEAVDSLSSGLLFCEADGSIVLINRRMQALMDQVCGKVHTNGRSFQEHVWEDRRKIAAASGETDARKGITIRLPDGEAWWFSEYQIHVGKQTYFQVSASDVSRQWQFIDELEAQNKRLLERSQKLRRFIDNLFEIRRHQEILRMRNKIHDVLGQHISLLVRRLEQETDVSGEELSTWIEELTAQLYTRTPPDSQARLRELKEVFQSIGVTLRQSGTLPADPPLAEVFVSVIREASTNAVRHGLATIVEIDMRETEDANVLTVTDNGALAPEGVSPGGGIRSMEYSAGSVGGELIIETQPRFSVTAHIPKTKLHAEEEAL